MPKIKTHSGAKKRFTVTKSGKIKRGQVGKRHLLNGHGKTSKRLRHLRKEAFADATNVAQVKRLIPYK
ncbi:50S ribosomal protein L35 [Butyricicoccus faecihominis]|uniref:50S ribosomal protein L35 n=1 Tax=Butyricicoccaceae TaxID=3085642 RepID=UPI002479D3D5|nr:MULTISPECIES: 50S ribosomal protein L35 [Butyricicoccaceae]MCQ5131291.1 50S ribosomal protein L35 [Butyricicoccus faecihominis]WNX83711.1 50S ribosomal protein L35 [Agathobaculum sp. NTUH-O15-33]